MHVYLRFNKWNLYSLWVLSVCLPYAVTITNSCVHHIGWEEIRCVWQSTGGHSSQPVGVQGTRSAACEVRFPPPSRRGSPTASLYYNGDSGEYHAESVYWMVNIFIVSGVGPLCAGVGPLAARGNGNTGNFCICHQLILLPPGETQLQLNKYYYLKACGSSLICGKSSLNDGGIEAPCIRHCEE